MNRNHLWVNGAALAVLLLASAGTSRADEASDRCGGAKMKAAGQYGQALLKCNSTATRRDEALDPDCVTKASGKLARSFDKAENKGVCATSDDEGTTEASLGADVDAVLAALAPDAT
ncbi:MAG: hypothetical protein ABR587_07225, partial [Candidatus Binatia bacterium]